MKEEIKVVPKVTEPQPEPPPIKRLFSPSLKQYLTVRVLRYYGRKKAEESESEISVDSESSEEQTRLAPTSSNQLFILDIFSVVWSRNGKNSSKGPADKKVSKILFQSSPVWWSAVTSQIREMMHFIAKYFCPMIYLPIQYRVHIFRKTLHRSKKN